MSKCTKTAKEEIREELLKDAAKELRDQGLTPEIAKEVLKLIEDSDLDDKDNVHVRVVSIKKVNKKNSEASQEDSKEEEAAEESTEEPESEKESMDAGDLIRAHIRFARAMKDAATEFYKLSCMTGEILRDNQELRARLGEK